MTNKINGKPYPYMSLWQFLKYELEGLNNTYSRQKEKAFYVQCHYAKHKNQNNRYKMNLNFRICSEYKKKIQIVNQWIKEIEKIEQVKKENEQLKQQCEEYNHKYCDSNDLLKQKYEENKQLAKRICELQSDLSKAKSMNEKMKKPLLSIETKIKFDNGEIATIKHRYGFCDYSLDFDSGEVEGLSYLVGRTWGVVE